MQFQNSSFLLLITLVILLFGFNMLGLFEIRLPRILLDLMPKNHQGFIGDFLRGFLTTIMSTPCSAPFVGTAITFAFSESYSIMLIIFFTMSIGLSSPWILVALYPKFINYLPSSGKWMLKLKYVLGVLLLLTSVWTLSMFSKSVSINNFSENYYSENGPTLLWEKGLAQKLASEGNIVLIDITADWCITCKLNKFIMYNNKKINEKIQNGDLKIIQGDWTLPNEDILNFLAENKRYGIPYNSVHGPNNIEGIILPEILTVKTLLNTIKQVKE
jgi:suppressor for copper-sensitivity B